MSPKGHFCTLSLLKRNEAASREEPKKFKLPIHPASAIFDVCIAGSRQAWWDIFWQYPHPRIVPLWLLGIKAPPPILKPHTIFSLCKNWRHITGNIKLARPLARHACNICGNGFRKVASLTLEHPPPQLILQRVLQSLSTKAFFPCLWLEGGSKGKKGISLCSGKRRTRSITVKYSLPGPPL